MTEHTQTANTPKTGGVNRSHATSFAQKLTFAGLHFTVIALCFWLVSFGGLTALGGALNREWEVADHTRALILAGCALLYGIRHLVTLFYLLARRVDWGEVLGLAAFMASFEVGFLLLGGVWVDEVQPLNWHDGMAVALLLIGSALNTGSECQRKFWKQDPANKGHCYTGGLFRYSMHINYFGDVVLFSGWALFTTSVWAFSVPLLMALMFVFFHIPGLDAYLSQRYGAEFDAYAKKTKRLIPFVY